jgi:hypothetical protein
VLYLTGTVDGDPGLGWGDPASDFYAMDWDAAEEALSWLFDNAHRVWVYRIYDTVTDPEGWVRAWLDAHGTAFADYVFGGESQLRVQGYLTGADPLGPPCPAAPESGVVGAGALALEGVTPLPAQVAAGGTLDLAAVWRAGDAPAGSSPLADAYLFAGLFDDEGGRWAQADARPAGPLYPAASWPAGAQVRTPLRVDVPVSTPPGDYRVALGWYRFEAGLPVWLPWPDGHLFTAGQVRVVPPAAGWANVAAPEPAFPAGVDLGGARLLGFDAGTLGAAPGDVLALHLLWRAPGVSRLPLAAAPAVLQLVDGDGAVVAAWASGPAGGRAPFPGLAPGQIVRDPRWLALPGDLAPGVYDLYLGRRTPDGAWLPVRRGPVALGPRYPLATVRVAAPGE